MREPRLLAVSLFASAKDNQPSPLTVTWADLCHALSTHETRPDKDGPAWSPARFRTDAPRAIENVEALSCLVFDLDEADPTIEHPEELQQYTHVLHSTHSGCWRLVLPLARDILPQELPELWQTTAERLGIKPDAACRDAARLYYLPSNPPGVEPVALSASGRLLEPLPRATAPAPVTSARTFNKPSPSPAAEKILQPLDVSELLLRLPRVGSRAASDARKLLEVRFDAGPGERNVRLHAACAALARYAGTGVDPESLLDLISRNFGSSMPLEGDTVEEWVAVARSSIVRAFANVEADRQRLNAAKAAVDALAPHSTASSYGQTIESVELLRNAKGDLQSCLYNLEQILERDRHFAGRVRLNELTLELDVTGTPLENQPPGYLDVALSSWLSASAYRMAATREACAAVLNLVARRHGFNPVRQWLEGLRWDGKSRVERFFLDYCGAEGNYDYLSKVGRKFFVACVARAFAPGAKVDTMLVLQGVQGLGKTRLVELLANEGEWSTTTKLDVNNKDSVQIVATHWLVELAELATLRRSDMESFKAFLTTTHDSVRMPYERTNAKYPRRGVFIGTTNDDEFLEDDTGHRRFWPVSVTRVDYERIKADLTQIWAEATEMYLANIPWWVLPDERNLFAEEAGVYARESPVELMAARISDWYTKKAIEQRPKVLRSADIAQYVFMAGVDEASHRGLFIRIGKALRRLGCRRERTVSGYVYVVPDALRRAERLSSNDSEQELLQRMGAK